MQRSDDSAVTLSAAGAWTVALLMATAALGHFNRVGMTVAGSERLMTEYSLSEVELGMVYSGFLLSYTLCMIPGGWLIDRFGAPFALTAMGLGMSVFVAATGAIGLVAGVFSHTLLLCIRACAGACSAPLHPACARMVSLCVPKSQQTFANGLVTGSAVLGIAVTFKIFGGLIDGVGWQYAFLISSAATAALAAVWTMATRSAPTGARSRTGVSDEGGVDVVPMSADQRRRLIWLTVSFAALNYFEYLFFYWLNHYLANSLKLPTDDARWAAAIPMVGMAVGMPAGGWLSDRLTNAGLHRGWVPAVGLVLGAASVLAGASCSLPIPAVVCFTLAMTAAGASEAPYWAASTRIGGRRGGTAAAILNTGGNAGGLLAPVITPILSRQLGWQGAISVVALICLPAALLWIWIGTDETTASEPLTVHAPEALKSLLKADEALTS